MDPIERINIAGDSTFALLLEARARGHELYYYTPERLSQLGRDIFATAQPLKVQDVKGDHAELGEPARRNLREFDVVLLRQDPPFDLAYITSTHFLERLAPQTLVVNDPAAVRNAPEKLLVMEFCELMPPTLITRDRAEIERFRERHESVVMKPLYGHGGAAVFRVMRKDANFGSLYDMFSVTFREPWVVQEYMPAVVKGDKRIILVEGKAMGAVNRVPAADDIRSNMVRGGRAEMVPLTAAEQAICDRIGPELKRRGLVFVGIDVIGDKITEINVTSPTGIRAIQRLGGPDLASAIWDAIEARRAALK
jgi:glutathione synthase